MNDMRMTAVSAEPAQLISIADDGTERIYDEKTGEFVHVKDKFSK